MAEVWHGIIGDRATAFRIRNAAKVSEELERDVATRGLKLNHGALPESYAFRWFEKASEEDEPELQALFARLLANAATGNEAALQRQNIELISRMTPEAARLFSTITSNVEEYLERSRFIQHGRLAYVISNYRLNAFPPIKDRDIEFQILMNIGVICNIPIMKKKFGFSEFRKINDFDDFDRIDFSKAIEFEESVGITSLGMNLISALSNDNQSEE